MAEKITIEQVFDLLRKHTEDTNARWDTHSERMGLIENEIKSVKVELTANTEMTAIVRDVVTTTRIATKVMKWVGAMALAVGSMWWAFKEIVNHNNVGPTP